MKKILSLTFTLALALQTMFCSAQTRAEFINYEFPKWFSEAKLGIMIHYGLYSIPSFSDREQYSEWFYKGLVTNDTLRINFQKRVFGEDFRYFDYMKLFKAEMFNADEWARLFKASGAKYVVFTTKHHDGFCLYDSKYTEKTSMNTPAKRDFVRELTDAVRKQGMRMGLYYSLTEWTNPLFRWGTDTVGIEKYVSRHMIPQFEEIVDKYKPSLIFADGDWDFSYKTLRSDEIVQYYLDEVGKDEAIVNNRWGNGFDWGFKTPEYSSGIKEKNIPWAECRSLSRSFALNRINPLEDYMTDKELVSHFMQLVSLGGGLMLNVSPAADGHIPLLQQERLINLGRWLEINHEAVYGSAAYDKPFEYQDVVYSHYDSETIDYNWVRNSPVHGGDEDNFSITWTNTVTPDKTASYTFCLDADDEAVIEIKDNDKLLLSLSAQKDKPLQQKIKLQKGKTYDITVFYQEKDVDAHCSLYWKCGKGDSIAMRGDSEWKGEVTWQKPVVCYTVNNGSLYATSLEKFSHEIVLNLDREPKSNMQVTLLGNEDIVLPWTYENGKLTVSLLPLTLADIKSENAWVLRLKDYMEQ